MNKIVRVTLASVAAIIVLVSIFLAFYLNNLFPRHLSKVEMEEELAQNKNLIEDLTNFVTSLDYSYIVIEANENNGFMYASNKFNTVGKQIRINNKEIITKLNFLFYDCKYDNITKLKNGVYFNRLSDIGFGQGVVHSIDGKPPQNELLTKLELIRGDWYYYEEE